MLCRNRNAHCAARFLEAKTEKMLFDNAMDAALTSRTQEGAFPAARAYGISNSTEESAATVESAEMPSD